MKLSQRENRIILFGAVVLSIGLLARFLIFPMLEDKKTMAASIQAKRMLLDKYAAALKKKPEIEARRARLKEDLAALEPLLFTGASPALVSARLQSTVERIITQRGGTIERMKTLKPENAGDYTKIRVEIIFTSGIRPFLDVLYDVGNHPQSLSIIKMDVHFKESRVDPTLRATIKVEAGMANQAPQAKRKAILSLNQIQKKGAARNA